MSGEADLRWPNTLPADDRILDLLLGRASPPAPLAEPTARLSAELKGAEISALGGADGATEAWLREALLMRWRLYAAMHTRPSAEADIDGGGAAELLRRAGTIADGAPVGVEWTKKHLVAAIVEFGRGRAAPALDRRSSLDPRPTRPSSTPEKRSSMVSPGTHLPVFDAAKREARRKRVISILFVLCLLGGGAFHGYRFLLSRQVQPRAFAPPGTLATAENKAGSEIVRLIDPKEHDNAARALSDRARASGRTMIEPARGFFVILPPGVKPPDLASMPTPAAPPARP
ncbi:MAG: hypothetical protein U1E65_07100 [Myxococcota bacterium]